MADLLPCPFCGGEPVTSTWVINGEIESIECGTCEASIGPCGGGDVAAAWNRRTVDWPGLMRLLDQHWPADVFPPGYDPARDAGARIVGLLRWVDQLKKEANRCT